MNKLNSKNMIDFKVWVRCLTYNHSKYITDALNGFCMQQTNFPFVCTIMDDSSTDGEQDIIKRYVEENFDLLDAENVSKEGADDFTLTFARHKKNKNCYFSVYLLKYNHYTINKPKLPYLDKWSYIKYMALCEGDDFWTHPDKLQIQFNFLESHLEHSLCFHANYSLYSDGTRKEHRPYSDNKEICPVRDIILGGGGYMATATMFYIAELGNDYRIWAKSSPVGDKPLMLTLAERGKVGYINEIMSCYRKASDGSWTQRILMNKEKNKLHHEKTLLSWKEFDAWTDYKYHKLIKKRYYKDIIHYWLKRNGLLNYLINLIKKYK